MGMMCVCVCVCVCVRLVPTPGTHLKLGLRGVVAKGAEHVAEVGRGNVTLRGCVYVFVCESQWSTVFFLSRSCNVG